MRSAIFALALLVAPIGDSGAASKASGCEAKSRDVVAPLLELYTSEGCDSCPPADQWLATLAGAGIGRERLVPLAFHVDYWDDLGWIDRFSQSVFTARQRAFVHRTGAVTAYTPEFVLNGREYRRWSTEDLRAQLQHAATMVPQADIALTLNQVGAALQVNGEAKLRDTRKRSELYVALYENKLTTDVRAGENRGRTLRHDAVVRRLVGPLSFDAAGKLRMRESFALPRDWKIGDLGVAAFVQDANGTEIFQALALDVCSNPTGK